MGDYKKVMKAVDDRVVVRIIEEEKEDSIYTEDSKKEYRYAEVIAVADKAGQTTIEKGDIVVIVLGGTKIEGNEVIRRAQIQYISKFKNQ